MRARSTRLFRLPTAAPFGGRLRSAWRALRRPARVIALSAGAERHAMMSIEDERVAEMSVIA